MRLTSFLLLAILAIPAAAQRATTHETRPGVVLSNDKIEFTVLNTGGAFVEFILKDDPKKLNPLWEPIGAARKAGIQQRFGPSAGHFLCVDGFGPTTKEEQAAGYSFHGEASKLPWDTVKSSDLELTQRVHLPVVQENYQRTVKIAPGEQVVSVEATLDSELSFDRPLLWAEHATIGVPFLKLGRTVVDQSTTMCRTKPHLESERNNRTFPSGQDFPWPTLKLNGKKLNLRTAPEKHGTMNHIGCLMDPKRDQEFITALNLDENLLVGYLFKRSDYAWVQHWMNYPDNGTYAWGLEFGMQPYDMTKRALYELTPMFGTPTFSWLPAKSKVSTHFLMFLTRVPDGFKKVDDVRLSNGEIVLEDKASRKRVTLKTSHTL